MSEHSPENVFNSAIGNVLSTFHAVVDEARNPRHEYRIVTWPEVAALAFEGWQMHPGGIVQPAAMYPQGEAALFVMFRQVSPAEQAAEQIARQAAAAGPQPSAPGLTPEVLAGIVDANARLLREESGGQQP